MNGFIHHLEIYFSDINKSKKFYSWLLGLLGYSLYQEWREGFSFKLNGTYIVFVQVDDSFKQYGYHRKRIGLNHLAFTVEDRVTVDDINIILEHKNINRLYDDLYPYAGGNHHYAVYFEDPDKMKIEIVSKE